MKGYMTKINNDSGIEELISYDKIRELTADLGMDVTWRKLNYYKSLGLLPRALRKPGDKRGYYSYYVFYDLFVFNFLQNNLGFTLQEIKKLIKDFKLPVTVLEDSSGGKRRQSVFSKWIQLTYGYFTTYLFNKVQRHARDLHFQEHRIRYTVIYNSRYKKALLESGIDYLAKNSTKTDLDKIGDVDFIAGKAKEWAETEAVKSE